MINYMRQYYLDERSGALYALLAGIVYLVAGMWLWNTFAGNALSRGMATGFLFSSVLLLALSVGSYFYNSNKLALIEARSGEPEGVLQQEEMARMDKVMRVTFPNAFRTFAVLIALALGVVLFVKNEYWRGVGIALMLLTMLLIISDSFSEQRNRIYQQRVKEL